MVNLILSLALAFPAQAPPLVNDPGPGAAPCQFESSTFGQAPSGRASKSTGRTQS